MHGATPATILDGRWRGPPDKMTHEFGEASSHIQHSIALIDGAMQDPNVEMNHIFFKNIRTPIHKRGSNLDAQNPYSITKGPP